MEYYAVIDTNVLLSALLSKREDSATVKVLDAVFDGKIIPLYHQDMFYEVAMEKREDNAYLVTGNQKHYPIRDFIITPAEMIKIIETIEEDI